MKLPSEELQRLLEWTIKTKVNLSEAEGEKNRTNVLTINNNFRKDSKTIFKLKNKTKIPDNYLTAFKFDSILFWNSLVFLMSWKCFDLN